ncbi:cytochrome P450 [Actinomadura rupiterrae]|uniref:cytochrome P450 n=1 Tax=Actinomadura rupiterrae TaxID=559627 RepID=UPI0020A288BF|nr:cytochrome P450 [Actinomadura rupiterrae]MCP2340028.1 cytochrome P450 [Actinomadura rupiterrae]
MLTRPEARLLWAANPWLYALVCAFRHAGPLTRVPRVGWVVTDPVLARRVLNDHAAFTMGGEGGVGHLWAQLFGPDMGRFFDGPRHAELRTAVRDLFTEDAAHDLIARTQGPHHARLAVDLAGGATVDLADSARVLAGRMVCDLLGLPPQDYRRLFTLGERLASLALGTTASTDLPAAVLSEAGAIVDELTAAVPSAYRSSGPSTLLGRCRMLGLGEDVARGLATLLVVAGTETGVSGTLRTVSLLHDAGQQRLLLDDPELLASAVREGLRVATPAPLIGRHVARNVRLAPHAELRAGQRVLVLTYLANNAVGPFDITRPYVPETRQLWFGAGRHLCLGAAVARAQAASTLRALLASGRPYQITHRVEARRALVPTYTKLLVKTSA